MSAAVERHTAHIGCGFPWDADLQQHLTVECAVTHGVIAIVSQPDRVIGPHMDAMGAVKNVLTPGFQEVAFAIQNDHRMRAAVEAVNPVPAIDPDGGDITKLPTIR